MNVGVHQPNFVPWLPYFFKMAMCDKFVLLNSVQFEKNGFQNRFEYKGNWITKPVQSGLDKISNKHYTDGSNLALLNKDWIKVIAKTLDIKAEIVSDDLYAGIKYEDSTERLVDLVEAFGGGTYVTNPSAKDKYLDEKQFLDAGISIKYCKVPKHLQIPIFVAFERYGIEGLIKQLPRRELCKV